MFKTKDYKVTLFIKGKDKVFKNYYYFFGVRQRKFDGVKRVEKWFNERFRRIYKIKHSVLEEITPPTSQNKKGARQ